MATKTLDELMGDWEAERLAQIAREEARRNAPAERARMEAKKKAEFDAGVRNGWWDANGNPIGDDDEDDPYGLDDDEDD